MDIRIEKAPAERIPLIREKNLENASLAQNFRVSPTKARKLAEEEFDRLLPKGINTEDHYFYDICNASLKPLGHLWFSEREIFGIKKLFICDIYLEKAVRGQGLGRKAILWLEEECKKMGLDEIALHVFGDNQGARRLYEELGFVPTSIQMSKRL
jgi:ribosomal protein S18 acetylase RimI-like enzyme